MASWRRAVVILVAMVGALACVAGRDFVRPPPETLALGTTTYKDVTDRFGTPFREETETANERMLKRTTYAYSVGKVRGEAFHDEVTLERAMIFYFLNDVLVGHRFVSSFKTDHTDFDESKVSSIKRGETTTAR